MEIRIVNLKTYRSQPNEVLINIEESILHSPYKPSVDTDAERKRLCNAYKEFFYKSIETNKEFKAKIDEIIELSKTNKVALGCNCFPKRCCCEVVSKYIASHVNTIEKTLIIHK